MGTGEQLVRVELGEPGENFLRSALISVGRMWRLENRRLENRPHLFTGYINIDPGRVS